MRSAKRLKEFTKTKIDYFWPLLIMIKLIIIPNSRGLGGSSRVVTSLQGPASKCKEPSGITSQHQAGSTEMSPTQNRVPAFQEGKSIAWQRERGIPWGSTNKWNGNHSPTAPEGHWQLLGRCPGGGPSQVGWSLSFLEEPHTGICLSQWYLTAF